MARSDTIKGPHHKLEELEKSSPDFLAKAREAVNLWGSKPGENYLVTAIAEVLQEVYALGLSRSPLPPPAPAPSVIRRSRPAQEAPAKSRVVRRRPS